MPENKAEKIQCQREKISTERDATEGYQASGICGPTGSRRDGQQFLIDTLRAEILDKATVNELNYCKM
jgi:hypothetical protein